MDRRTKEYKQFMKQQLAKQAYRVVLNINGEEHESINESLEDAILAVKPTDFKTNAILTVYSNGMKAEKRFNTARSKRLFANKVFRDFMIKMLPFKYE